jgi:transcriptional regulator with XRE-family HTH domain
MDTYTDTRYTNQPFGEALAKILFEYQANPWRTSLRAFADEVGINYATMRSAVTGRTEPQTNLLEAVSRVLGIQPDYWREYRTHKIREALDSHPDLIGRLYEYTMAEIAALDERQAPTACEEQSAAGTRGKRKRGKPNKPDEAEPPQK